MKVKDILNKKHTVLNSVRGYDHKDGVNSYTQTKMSMRQIIFDLGKLYKEKINEYRELGYHSEEQKIVKPKFPVWFVGGVFPLQKTEDIDIIEYSNILAIDIDKKDNTDKDIEYIRKQLLDLPYVFAVFKSISGEGIYALILLEDGQYTKEYYNYIAKLWKKQYDLNTDEQCTNIGRKRFLSYEENIDIYIKSEDTDIVPWKLRLIEPKEEYKKKDYIHSSKYEHDGSLVRKAIWKLLNNGYSIDHMNVTSPYGVWYHIACDFHHFDDGFDMFVRFSQNSSKYNDKLSDIQKKYNNGKIECPIEDVSKKWCGICKRIYGSNWWKD